jgi:hypothetical protein
MPLKHQRVQTHTTIRGKQCEAFYRACSVLPRAAQWSVQGEPTGCPLPLHPPPTPTPHTTHTVTHTGTHTSPHKLTPYPNRNLNDVVRPTRVSPVFLPACLFRAEQAERSACAEPETRPVRHVRLPAVRPWPGDAGNVGAGNPAQHDTAEAVTVPAGAAVDMIVGSTIFRLPVADMVDFSGKLGEQPPDQARATYIDAIPKLMARIGLPVPEEPVHCSTGRAGRTPRGLLRWLPHRALTDLCSFARA